jgi:aspartate-semialdehyde dehydrogenase
MKTQTRAAKDRIPVGIIGATGAVGQRFVQLLDNHPWFQVVALTGSDRAVGQNYEEACHWILPTPIPDWARELVVWPTIPKSIDVPLAFSALPSIVAQEAEPIYARSGTAICSNASAFRQEPDIPLILPEVNPEHTELVHEQRKNRNWQGFIITNPNCTITGPTIVLKALLEGFGVRRAFVVSLQAVSGAGYPGVPSLDILGNVIPHIEGEEEKMEWEPRKMLGKLRAEKLELADFELSAHANRVPVSEGHTVCLSVELSKPATIQEVARAMSNYLAPEISRELPAAPPSVIQVTDKPDRPQPRLDVLAGRGMTTVVGRLRPDPIFDYKMVVLSHNTIRGAAGGSIYNAELLLAQGLLDN